MYFSLKYAPCLIAVSLHLRTRLFKSPNSLPLNAVQVMCLIFWLTSECVQNKIKLQPCSSGVGGALVSVPPSHLSLLRHLLKPKGY